MIDPLQWLGALPETAGGSAVLAAWVQAVGTILAVFIALSIPALQRSGDRRARRRIADQLFADVERDIRRIGGRLAKANDADLVKLASRLRVCERALTLIPAMDLGDKDRIYLFFRRLELCRELGRATRDLLDERDFEFDEKDPHHGDAHGHGGGHAELHEEKEWHGRHGGRAMPDRDWAEEFRQAR